MERRKPRLGFVLLGLVLVGLIAWLFFASRKPAPARKPPVVAVTVAPAMRQDVPLAVTALGSAQPWQGVTIRSQVGGKLLRVNFREGSFVKAGQVLAEVDSAAFRAVLMQAQGALKRDQALLEQARVDLKRYDTLVEQDSIARQTRDQQAALVKQDEGLVLIDRGSVAAAQVNVNYCRITAPISGRVGVRLVDPGNLVSTADTNGIAIVNQISPIAVTFTVPQGDFQRLATVSNGFARPLPTEADSQDTGQALDRGELSIADNHVDPTTGTVQLKARFPNPAGKLWPGQFVNVRLTLQTLSQATVIPAAAVNRGPNGSFAYVIGPGDKAEMRPIQVEATQDTIAVITSGVQPGERVVTDGQMSLKPGAAVAIREPGAGGRHGAGGGRKGSGKGAPK